MPTTCSGNVFSDVNLTLSGSEFCGYIEALALAGRVPTLQAQFFPNSMVTRVDMYSMIVAAIGEAPSSVSQPFTDI